MILEDKHKKLLRPSSAERWVNCPASLLLSADLPEQPSSKAAEVGSRYHKQAHEILLKDGKMPYADKIKAYIEYAKTFMGNKVYSVSIEARIFDRKNYLTGTPDFVVHTLNGVNPNGQVEIIDLKTGFINIYPQDNKQLFCYAYLVRQNYNIPVIFRFTIIQNSDIRRYAPSEEELETNFKKIDNAIEKVIAGDMTKSVGKWCQYCRAKYGCEEYKKTVC